MNDGLPVCPSRLIWCAVEATVASGVVWRNPSVRHGDCRSWRPRAGIPTYITSITKPDTTTRTIKTSMLETFDSADDEEAFPYEGEPVTVNDRLPCFAQNAALSQNDQRPVI